MISSDYPKVLYVEDDALSRKVAENLLREQIGLRDVAIFEDSRDFEARLQMLPFEPDIILLNIHLKPLTGFQMLAILRRHPIYQHKPVIALTASVVSEEVDQLREAGFNGVLAKP